MSYKQTEAGIFIPSQYREIKSDNVTNSYQLMQYMHGSKPKTINPDDFYALTTQGFMRSVIAGRCVELTSEAVGSIRWVVRDKRNGEILKDHPLQRLLEHPHPMMSRSAFFYQLQQFKSIGGTAYIRKIRPDSNSVPGELELLPPQNMYISEGRGWIPEYYEYSPQKEGPRVRFPVNQIDGKSDILRIYFPHPLSPFKGLSPMAKAMGEILQVNEGADHNSALLRNSATPSGMLSFKQEMNPEEQMHVQKLVDERFVGAENAGRPVVASEANWTSLGLTPKELDFVMSRRESNKLVAAAFGVPSILIGSDMDSSTYSNMKEVRLNFTLDTILPQVDLLATELTRFLCDDFDEDIEISYDMDAIESLSALRDEQYQRYGAIEVMTLNERREKLKLNRINGLDGFSFVVEHPEEEAEDIEAEADVEEAPEPDTNEDKGFTQVDLDLAVEFALKEAEEKAALAELKHNFEMLMEDSKNRYGDETEVEVKAFESEVSVQDDEGVITFYAASFARDKANDIIRPHAFNRTINGKMPAFCWQHDITNVVGTIKSMRVDEKGLLCTAKFATKTTQGRNAYELYKSGAMSDFSIGYIVRRKSYDRAAGVRYLDEIQLREISCVTIPANDEATLLGIKSED